MPKTCAAAAVTVTVRGSARGEGGGGQTIEHVGNQPPNPDPCGGNRRAWSTDLEVVEREPEPEPAGEAHRRVVDVVDPRPQPELRCGSFAAVTSDGDDDDDGLDDEIYEIMLAW